MTERERLTQEIALLEAARAVLLENEKQLHDIYMAAPESELNSLDQSLDDIGEQLDEISDRIGCAAARLFLINSEASRREALADKAYGRIQ